MKEFIKKELNKEKQIHFKQLALSEILQHLILQSLSRHNSFKHITFTGGTALRLLYNTERFSEDLDFSLTEKGDLNLLKLLPKIKQDLELMDLKVDVHIKENESTVFKSDFRFPNILNELNLSPLKEQKLTIKFEVDKNSPKGWKKEIQLVSNPISYSVSIFDLPSLFATKLHAIFYRKYTKGRDYYDLIWYLGKQIKPNLKLFNNAVKQTHPDEDKFTEENFKERLTKRLESVDFKVLKKDVERLIINREELDFLKVDSIKSLLRMY